ncbi:MAG: hypothetical protein JSU73_10090 [candidate division WOR-3 bacterium]|nr:MAG: hypothetical protein JSU73_10090 [candidate division WOR-3 bacterium]
MRLFCTVVCAVLLTAIAPADWLSTEPDGGRLDAGCISPHDPEVIYVAPYSPGAYSRVHRSTDGGATWETVGTLPYTYTPYNLMVDPWHDSLVYATGSGNRFLRSTDHGETWSYVTTPIYMYYAAIDPAIPGRIYVVGYNSTTPRHPSFTRSDDRGLTWSPMTIIDSTVENQYAYSVAADSGYLFVGASHAGLYRSTDAGLTWAFANAGITPTTAQTKAFRIDPDDKNVVLAAASGGVFRTTNAGDTWVKTGSLLGYYMGFSTADPDIGYAGYNYVYRTTDRGLTWSRPNPGLHMRYLKGFGAHPTDSDLVYAWGSAGVRKSTDAGLAWTRSDVGLRVSTINSLSINPSDPSRIYLDMDDCGMYYSLDGGAAWDTCRYFLACGGICDIGVIPGADADILYALEGSG